MLKTETITFYECERCGTRREAATWHADDKPEGYYIHVRRVTPGRYHRISDELFLCTKDCLLEFFTYGVSGATEDFRPIGRPDDILNPTRYLKLEGRWIE